MLSERVDATRQELRQAFHSHWSTYRTDRAPKSHWLVLFYAVECGLKLKILSADARLRSTKDLVDKLRSHNINILLNEAGLGHLQVRTIRVGPASHHPTFIDPKYVHEVWRYGVDMDPQDASQTRVSLERIADELVQEGF